MKIIKINNICNKYILGIMLMNFIMACFLLMSKKYASGLGLIKSTISA